MDVEDRDSLERLQVAARQRRNTPVWTRVQAIVLAKQGDFGVRIAHALERGRRSVQTWPDLSSFPEHQAFTNTVAPTRRAVGPDRRCPPTVRFSARPRSSWSS
jgi:hypothetical protein